MKTFFPNKITSFKNCQIFAKTFWLLYICFFCIGVTLSVDYSFVLHKAIFLLRKQVGSQSKTLLM